MSKSWIWRLGVAIALLAGIVASASAFGAQRAGGGSPGASGPTVRIGWVPAASWTPWASLKAEGVNVELIPFKSSNDSLTALANGSIQMAPVGYNNLAALLTDSEPKIRFVSGISENGSVFIARKGSGITTWADLKGKRIASVRGSTQYVNLATAMQSHGLDLNKDATFVNMQGFSDLNFALQRGDVDAISTFPPLSGQAVAGGQGVEVPEIQRGMYDGSFTVASGILAGDDFLSRHPDQAEQVLRGFAKRFDELAADPGQWAGSYAELTGVAEEKSLVDALRKQYIKPSLRLDEKAIRSVPEVLTRLDIIKRDTGDELADRLDYDLLSKVTGKSAAELGKGK
ncbi:ABC transporter substrate-binding protein [Nonomuraea sp. NPDC050404]|uniref:ABC transporter substrate-binding protein n=1 Tax=Nonomuraea sp. NPDC050404 TaxID=3155783 RepID=UPI0034023DBC